MKGIRAQIREDFYGTKIKFLPKQDDKLVGYAEMFGNDCIPLYTGINYFPCTSLKKTEKQMLPLNKKARIAIGFEKTIIGYIKLDNGSYVYLHDKGKILKQLTKEYEADTTGLFEDQEDCETSAVEMYDFNIIGAYMEGIPAFAVLYSE